MQFQQLLNKENANIKGYLKQIGYRRNSYKWYLLKIKKQYETTCRKQTLSITTEKIKNF